MQETEMLQLLGNRLREIRKTKGLTQQEVADRGGLNRNYIAMLERGERNPTFINLCKIAKGCGVKLGKLVE